MATQNISQQINTLQKAHGAALSSLKRSRRVMRALRSLTESKLEKNLVNAGHETLERAFEDMTAMGARLRDLSQSVKVAEEMQVTTTDGAGSQVEPNPQTQFSE